MEIVHQGLSSDTESAVSFQNAIVIAYMLENLLVFVSAVVCSDCPFRSILLGFGRVIYQRVFLHID